MGNKQNRILIVDDNLEMHTLLEACLHPVCEEIVTTDSGQRAVELLRDEEFAVVVLDLMLPDLDGIEVLQSLRENQRDSSLGSLSRTAVIILTAHGSLETAIEALRLGAYDYVEKPFYIESVRAAVRRALEKRRTDARLEAIQELSREMTLSPEVEQAAGMVIDFVDRVLAFHNCGLMVLDEDGEALYTLAARGIGKEMAPRLPVEGAGITVAAFREQEMVYVPRVDEDNRYVPIAPEVRSEVAVPLMTDGEVLGVLNVESSEADPFTEDDLRLLSALSDQTAVAIKNAQLHEQAQREIAQRRKVEVALREAKQRAEAANRAKSEFLARMSHEIRTPIHGIRGVTDLLRDTDLSREQREYLGLIRDSAESLSIVVTDILDFSKIEAGKLELETTAFDLRAVAEEATAAVAPKARGKGLELICHVPPEVPTALMGDPVKLREVLINLVDNAVKFTHEGEVVMEVKAEDESPEDVALEFEVRDTGIGIPEEKQDHIFGAFHQADSSTTREYGGTGLGLTIADRLVRLMDGRIWFESSPGEGSTFFVALRLKKQSGASSSPDQHQVRVQEVKLPALNLSKGRALIIDGNEASRLMLHEQLSAWGYAVAEADTHAAGLSAIEEALKDRAAALENQGSSNPFDLVLLDVGRADGDGFATLQDIQDVLPSAEGLVPMLSSDQIHRDIERCSSLGVHSYLVKPVERDALRSEAERVLAQGATSGQPEPEAVGKTSRGLDILLVEDNRAAQLVAKRTLEGAGHTVGVVADGRAALESVDADAFDLVLMDIEMPEMDGIEVIKRIRTRELEGEDRADPESLKRVPIVAISAYGTDVNREESLEAGADAYLSKPISPTDLDAWICDNFSSVQRADHEDVVDLEMALESTADDETLLVEAVNVFVSEDYPRHLASLKDALDRQNAEGVAKAAHGISGPAESFGGRALMDVASELGPMARSGDFAGVRRTVERLETEMERFSSFFNDVRMRETA